MAPHKDPGKKDEISNTGALDWSLTITPEKEKKSRNGGALE
jgi:hypothetical protein